MCAAVACGGRCMSASCIVCALLLLGPSGGFQLFAPCEVLAAPHLDVIHSTNTGSLSHIKHAVNMECCHLTRMLNVSVL
jgi:hypothetical protein